MVSPAIHRPPAAPAVCQGSTCSAGAGDASGPDQKSAGAGAGEAPGSAPPRILGFTERQEMSERNMVMTNNGLNI